jgi:hypothetical protein
MRPLWIFGILLCLLAMQAPAAAQAPTNKWTFQRTGFRTTSGPTPQTALSMRSGEAWPVVYGFYENSLNAYSLFPVVNTKGKHHVGPATNWHQIGSNLTGTPFPTANVYLQADSGSPDGFAVSAQTPASSSLPQDAVAIGNSLSGFQSPMTGVQAVKFDDNGNPFTASNSLIPSLTTSTKIFDVALSKSGDIGAVTQFSGGDGPLIYWQRSPLLGNTWYSTAVPSGEGGSQSRLSAPTVDLIFDGASRPHIIGVSQSRTPANRVLAQSFDITTGAWITSTLDTGSSSFPGIADVAAASNDDGILGAAWVNNGALKYAYLDTKQISPSWVVTTVANTTPTGLQLELAQGVGLAFDNAGLPVISFVDRTMRQIWVAYDPPTAFGGAITDQPGAEGDFNGDGFVDGYDVDAWSTGFGEGTLDGNDFLAWQRNANIAEPSAATAAVPEPLALSSACVAATLLFGSMRTSRRTAN